MLSLGTSDENSYRVVPIGKLIAREGEEIPEKKQGRNKAGAAGVY